MKPLTSAHSVDAPSVEDIVPGGTERLVRSIIGDEVADHVNRKHPGRINTYCDAVRFVISTLRTMGAIDGEKGLPVQFPEDLMGLKPAENRLLLEGLVASGRLVRAEAEGRAESGGPAGSRGYRLTRRMLLAIDPGSGPAQ